MTNTFKPGDEVVLVGPQPDLTKGKLYVVTKLYYINGDTDGLWIINDWGIRDAYLSKYFILAGRPFQRALRKIANYIDV